MSPQSLGILLTNTGTPDAPTPRAVWRYLSEFLSDKRVVRIPRLLWWPLLYGLILPRRCFYSAKLYQKIWTDEGSPLRYWMEEIAEGMQNQFSHAGEKITVAIGMNYGNPSIEEGLEKLRQNKIDKIIVLPLFPQYSSTTSAASFDKVAETLARWTAIPELHFISQYADHPDYIDALCTCVQTSWQSQGRAPYLLFSFHGIPELVVEQGDPYPKGCIKTAELMAEKLKLAPNSWSISYQSRLGYARWLSPYTNDVLQQLPQRGIKDIDVVCPGFAVDCLETLEEIAIRSKAQFLQAGGRSLRYLPALNSSDEHIKALVRIALTLPSQ